MKKIGIVGGTFDPIHNGHLLLGKQACQEFELAQVWFMPSGAPPHKQDHEITESHYRCDMVKLAIEGDSRFTFSDFEVSRKGTTYTAETLRDLQRIYPDYEFFFIIGADSLYQMEHWYRPEIILSGITILVAEREYERAECGIQEKIAYLCKKYSAVIFRLHSPMIDISSERLRQAAAEGKSLANYVPEKVEQYIKAHHLYEVTKDEQ